MDTDTHPRWTLSELTREAGVSIRTVRYYIAEGLLPPPDVTGPRSSYSQGHLDRLRLIDRLKANYLPLKEIRRRLSSLDDDEVRHLLATESDHAAPNAATPPHRATSVRRSDSASDYIARLLNAPDAAPAPPAPVPSAPSHPTSRQSRIAESIAPELDHDELPRFSLQPPPMPEAAHSSFSHAEPDSSSWRRIPLSDDAELLIRDDTYQRKRDRVDWLIDWARKVFH